MQAVFSQLSALRMQNDVLQNDLTFTRHNILTKLKIISTNIHRISLIPAQVATTLNNINNNSNLSNTPLSPPLSPNLNTGAHDTIHPTPVIREPKAKLAKNLKSLYILWHEFEFGVGDRRAAKTFSRKERGSCRHLYSKRNIFWSLVVEMF